MHLFAQTMLDAWKLYGDSKLGDEIQSEQVYRWKIELNGEVTTDEDFTIWEYLYPYALPGCWSTFDLVVALGIMDCKLSEDDAREYDLLYVGGGSGRFASAVAQWDKPLKCFSVDLSPQSVELMQLRNVPCALMDGHDMSALEDNSFPLVVLSPWSMGSSEDTAKLVAEAARVASEKVIATGWLGGAHGDEQPVTYRETMTAWNGETETHEITARHYNHFLSLFAEHSMVPIVTKTFLALDENPDELSWIIEVGFSD